MWGWLYLCSASPATATGLDTDALFTFFDEQLTKVAASNLPAPPNHDSQWTVGFQPGMFWLMVECDLTGAYGSKYRPVTEAWMTNLINRTPSQVH